MLAKVNKNPSPRDLRNFGITILAGFGIIGGVFYWRGKHAGAEWMWDFGAAVFIISLVSQRLTKRLYAVWMGLGVAIGSVVSPIVLTFIFLFVITPTALVFKVLGRDALRLRPDPKRKSYWTDHPKISEKSYYDRLF